MTRLKVLRRERDIAFDQARNHIWRARYSEEPLWPAEIAEAVRHARVSQWNAAAVYRWRVNEALRKNEVP